ncbi:MAG: alanine/glycine:cation symporter family protein [Candidatus Marinimicrobia bacterium]|jgi:AGCS family alanine or glycine:cation symporter|nr:alanine/glycine:cation symporter family protein [Candidatus Neomarinimicrobiota bacterium]|tara:strand:+ start:2823 stop:4184 length:1362 start_codon:yes stop_codon:yes gene_type:complete
MDFYNTLDSAMAALAGFLWGTPLVVLLLGGGIFFAAYSRLVPMLYFKHGIDILLGKYDSDDDPGQITHFEALSSALAGTVGMGNIAGVAVAIHTGGPGAVFWMWITAILGMSTKFFTCTLALMYRGKDDQGEIQGGVMYFIEEGLGRSYKPLAIMFSVSGLLGCIVFFQANQLSQIIRDYFYGPMQIFQGDSHIGNLVTGIMVATLVGIVIFGGIQRIAKVASRMVPTMVGLYIIAAMLILAKNIGDVPAILRLIIEDAFTGNAVSGGALGSVIIIGVRRGMFSNEAGTGTETMAHGAAKTTEPVREGLVAMLGPFIDTLVVCSITAIIILLSGVYVEDLNGVSMTAEAFKRELGIPGQIFLTIAVLTFALSTMFGYSYYGQKCASYVFGTRWKNAYNWVYIAMIVVGSVASIEIAVNFVDSAYALMVIPTMISTFLLAPRVLRESKRYFSSL